mmetsp:Transcript_1845/g.3320  ORF Transcript_1845/g.3320 Transcript_1845/m.3320 type:complete len:265 (-) Transcript_1845:249-1043(-)
MLIFSVLSWSSCALSSLIVESRPTISSWALLLHSRRSAIVFKCCWHSACCSEETAEAASASLLYISASFAASSTSFIFEAVFRSASISSVPVAIIFNFSSRIACTLASSEERPAFSCSRLDRFALADCIHLSEAAALFLRLSTSDLSSVTSSLLLFEADEASFNFAVRISFSLVRLVTFSLAIFIQSSAAFALLFKVPISALQAATSSLDEPASLSLVVSSSEVLLRVSISAFNFITSTSAELALVISSSFCFVRPARVFSLRA